MRIIVKAKITGFIETAVHRITLDFKKKRSWKETNMISLAVRMSLEFGMSPCGDSD